MLILSTTIVPSSPSAATSAIIASVVETLFSLGYKVKLKVIHVINYKLSDLGHT
jgi:hypothetical protein